MDESAVPCASVWSFSCYLLVVSVYLAFTVISVTSYTLCAIPVPLKYLRFALGPRTGPVSVYVPWQLKECAFSGCWVERSVNIL